jgi:hypothetical protein
MYIMYLLNNNKKKKKKNILESKHYFEVQIKFRKIKFLSFTLKFIVLKSSADLNKSSKI